MRWRALFSCFNRLPSAGISDFQGVVIGMHYARLWRMHEPEVRRELVRGGAADSSVLRLAVQPIDGIKVFGLEEM